MKISKSKQELARIISENGGWRDGAELAAQDKDGEVFGYCQKPRMGVSREVWGGDGCTGPWAAHVDTVRNWHQTILSRDEYFLLYQNQGLEDALDEPVIEAKPTIEQLAADYRNRKDYADRKQQEADAAKAGAEAKLAELVAAGEVLGLALSVAEPEPEPEPEPDACADGWVAYDGGGCPVDANEVVEVFLRKGCPSLDGPKAAHKWDWSIEDVGGDIVKWRRAKGGANA